MFVYQVATLNAGNEVVYFGGTKPNQKGNRKLCVIGWFCDSTKSINSLLNKK